jgi:hypothetical protein
MMWIGNDAVKLRIKKYNHHGRGALKTFFEHFTFALLFPYLFFNVKKIF